MSYFKDKICTKFDFGWGSAQTPLGELTALPQTLAEFNGPTSKGKGKKGRERRVVGKGGKEEG